MTTISAKGARTSRAPHNPVARERLKLLRAGQKLLRSAEDLLFRDGGGDGSDDPQDVADLVARLGEAIAEIGERLSKGKNGSKSGATLGELAGMLEQLQALRSAAHDHDVHERLDRLRALEDGLAPLRLLRDTDEMLSRACESVVDCCGFDRAMLSQVDGSVWRPRKSYSVTDREFEHRFRDWILQAPEIALDHLLLESEMVRRRRPALVVHPELDNRVYRPLLEASGLQSYVAAPLMPTGRVIGFLHADYENAVVTELDRDILWAFAEAFGYIFERAVLLRRLAQQREQVRSAIRLVETAMDDLANAEIELTSRPPHAAAPVTSPRTLMFPSGSPSSRIGSLLTPRELEVLELMATGATNSRIAQELVITDGTVKSHVKRILRKLHSANRSEAIARYLRLTMAPPSSPPS
jgi:DNA-binding CsgD family transcriptional regulator/GAF domain-containing protein